VDGDSRCCIGSTGQTKQALGSACHNRYLFGGAAGALPLWATAVSRRWLPRSGTMRWTNPHPCPQGWQASLSRQICRSSRSPASHLLVPLSFAWWLGDVEEVDWVFGVADSGVVPPAA
jgi:hypothetical protein